MNRRLLLLVTSPALLLGLVLIVACSLSALAINSVQTRLIRDVHDKVAGLRAAYDMELAIHELQFHCLVGLVAPTAATRRAIQADHHDFEAALRRAKDLGVAGHGPLLVAVQRGYERYHRDIQEAAAGPGPPTREDFLRWVEAHPLRQVIGPCQQLADANEKVMEGLLRDTQALAAKIQLSLLLLGVLGPLGGLLCGLAIARALSRSIARLQVLVQDVHSHITPQVGVVDVGIGGGLESLHDQMDRIVTHVRDLVERLQSQQREIIRSEQLALVGQLASSVAHEIRNPLTAMKWLVDDAIRSFPAETLRLQDLQVLQSEIDRVKQTVQGMLDFARPPELHPRRCDLRDLARQATELIRARKRQLGVTLLLDLPAHPVAATVDPAHIKSVLVNLLLNALDAMPGGGQLRVHVARAGPHARLVVEDTGPGIPPEVLERLFAPFVSTKPAGTGLGLNLSRRLVEQHGGQLQVENRPEGGARFVLTLPASA